MTAATRRHNHRFPRRHWTSAALALALGLLLLAGGPAARAGARPSAGATPAAGEDRACGLALDLGATPTTVRAGSSLRAAARLRMDCYQARLPADLVFVIQRSSAETDLGGVPDATRLKNVLEGVSAASAAILQRRDGSRVGLVSYDGSARLVLALTDDASQVASKAQGIVLGSTANHPAPGLDRAGTLLGGKDRAQVVILIGQGAVQDPTAAAKSVQRLRARGVRVSVLLTGETDAFFEAMKTDLAPTGTLSGADVSKPITRAIDSIHHWMLFVAVRRVEVIYRLAPAVVEGWPGPLRPPGPHPATVLPVPASNFMDEERDWEHRWSLTALAAGSGPVFAELAAIITYNTGTISRTDFPALTLTVVPPEPGSVLAAAPPQRGPLRPPRLVAVDALHLERETSATSGTRSDDQRAGAFRDLAYLDRDHLILSDEQLVEVNMTSSAIRPWPCDCPVGWKPAVLASDPERGRLVVADRRDESLWVFDRAGRSLGQLPMPAPAQAGTASFVADLAVDPDGAIYTLLLQIDPQSRRWAQVVRYDAALQPLAPWAPIELNRYAAGDPSYRHWSTRIAAPAVDRVVLWVRGGWDPDNPAVGMDWWDWLRISGPDGQDARSWRPALPPGLPTPIYSPDLQVAGGELWIQQSGWWMRYDPSGELIEGRPLDKRAFPEHVNADWLLGQFVQPHQLAPRPGGGATVPIRSLYVLSAGNVHVIADRDRWRLHPDHSTEYSWVGGWPSGSGLATFDADGRWTQYLSTREFGSFEPYYPEANEAVTMLRASALADGRLAIADPLSWALRVGPPGGPRGFLPVPLMLMDLASVPDGGMVLLGRDREGPALLRLAPEGTVLWRQACDCARWRGVALRGDEILVADSDGQSVRSFALADGAPTGRLDAASFHGLGPVDLAVGADGSLVLANLRQRRLESWDWPSGAVPPRDPVAVWPMPGGAVPLDLALAPDGTRAIALLGGQVLVQDVKGRVLSQWQPEADGYAAIPSDLLWSRDGSRLYVLDGRTAPQLGRQPRILTYAWPPEDPEPLDDEPPPPDPAPGACDIRGRTTLDPPRARVGQSVRVSHEVDLDCPEGAGLSVDLIVAAANPSRLGLEPTRRAARAVLGALVPERFRVAIHGLGSYGHCGIRQLLTSAPWQGIDSALQELELCRVSSDLFHELQAGGRASALPVVLALGVDAAWPGDIYDLLGDHAHLLARDGVVKVVELRSAASGETSPLVSLASRPEDYQAVTTEAAMLRASQGIVEQLALQVVRDISLVSAWDQRLEVVADSVEPPAGLRVGDAMRLDLASLARGSLRLSYQVRPREVGQYPVTRSLYLDYTEADAVPRRAVLPGAELWVEEAPPMPTPSPTPSPQPPDRRVLLPLLLREPLCQPAEVPLDVVLMIDASNSMSGAKLAAAREAAGAFVHLLSLGKDRVGLVAFHGQAVLRVGLTTDAAALQTALDGIVLGPGTRLDRGFVAAGQALDAAPRAGARRALVLLTDGRQDDEPGAAEAQAAQLREGAVELYAVGLGADADLAFLGRLVLDNRRLRSAADPEALPETYRQLARDLPCPAAAFWGGR